MGSGSWIRAWLVPNHRAAQCWSQWLSGLMGIDSHHGLWAGPQQGAAGQGPWSLGLLMLVGLGCQCLPSLAWRHCRSSGHLCSWLHFSKSTFGILATKLRSLAVPARRGEVCANLRDPEQALRTPARWYLPTSPHLLCTHPCPTRNHTQLPKPAGHTSKWEKPSEA